METVNEILERNPGAAKAWHARHDVRIAHDYLFCHDPLILPLDQRRMQAPGRAAGPVLLLRLFLPFDHNHIPAAPLKTLAGACQPESRETDVCLFADAHAGLFRIREGFICRQT